MNTNAQPVRVLRKLIPLCLVLALGVAPFLTGCVIVAAGAAGAGAVAYVRGEMEANLEHDLNAVFKAAQRALADLELAKIDDQKSGVDALLISRTALDKRVEIKLRKITGNVTKVQIRIGLMGDQELSLTILEKIKAGL